MSERPTYNHTRDDGPYNPCPECIPLMSTGELVAYQLARATDREEALMAQASEFQENLARQVLDAARLLIFTAGYEAGREDGIAQTGQDEGYPNVPDPIGVDAAFAKWKTETGSEGT